jgi:hypothetical protein
VDNAHLLSFPSPSLFDSFRADLPSGGMPSEKLVQSLGEKLSSKATNADGALGWAPGDSPSRPMATGCQLKVKLLDYSSDVQKRRKPVISEKAAPAGVL